MEEEDIIKSPSRQSLFRACKSPFKKTESANESKNERKDSSKSTLAVDLLDTFPEIDENFDIVKKVGEGTFSKVFLAKLRCNAEKMFAFKHLIPTSSPGRIQNELKCLQFLGGKHNVLGLETSLRHDDHVVFVLPYFPHKKFSDTVTRLSVEEIRNYMEQLFVALSHVHCHEIIHRDVKPSNFLYWKEKERFALIDFGLAMPVPGTTDSFLVDYTTKTTTNTRLHSNNTRLQNSTRPHNNTKKTPTVVNRCKHPRYDTCTACKSRSRQVAPRAGTPGFRSPEVLLRHPQQTTAVDMWSAGIILLSLLSRRYPFFKAKEDMEALAQIVLLFGSQKIKRMADTIGKDFYCNPPIENVYTLKVLCQKLARRSCALHRRRRTDASSELKSATKRKCGESYQQEHSPSKRRASQSFDDSFKGNLPVFNNSQEVLNNATITKNTFLNGGRSIEDDENDSNKNMVSSKKKISCNCIPDSAYDLLEKLLELNPDERLTAQEGLKHPFICASRR